MMPGGAGCFSTISFPGRRFQTGTVTVDPDRVRAFATEFDPQPFHLDEAAGGSSIFGSLVASGWHTAAMTMRLDG